MSIWQQFTSNQFAFHSFGTQHLSAVIVWGLFIVAAIWCVRNLNPAQNLLVSRATAVFLLFTVILWSLIKLYYDRFNLLVDLPLSLCNLFAATAPLLFWQPNRRRLEVIYFLVMSGTLQAIITPDLYVGFPSNEFFKYWIVHGGLVILVLHNIFSFQMYPRLKGVLVTFGWLNLYAALLYGFNLAIDANYFYLISKPGNPSILDFLGPWPIYIVIAELVAMVFFAISYVPFHFIKKAKDSDPM